MLLGLDGDFCTPLEELELPLGLDFELCPMLPLLLPAEPEEP